MDSRHDPPAKDGQQIEWAMEIRLRAERKVGALLAEMKDKGERDPGGRGPVGFQPATQRSDLGAMACLPLSQQGVPSRDAQMLRAAP